jgi:hypothetical protein
MRLGEPATGDAMSDSPPRARRAGHCRLAISEALPEGDGGSCSQIPHPHENLRSTHDVPSPPQPKALHQRRFGKETDHDQLADQGFPHGGPGRAPAPLVQDPSDAPLPLVRASGWTTSKNALAVSGAFAAEISLSASRPSLGCVACRGCVPDGEVSPLTAPRRDMSTARVAAFSPSSARWCQQLACRAGSRRVRARARRPEHYRVLRRVS